MDKYKPKWCYWCRLCAREDNVNLSLEQEIVTTANESKLSLETVLKKYFNVQMSREMPTYLCIDCNTFILSLVAFSERVMRVQQMYSHLKNINCLSDLRDIRRKYDVLNDDSHHPPLTEVVPIILMDEINETAENDDEPLDEQEEKTFEFDLPVEEVDPFNDISNSTSEDEIHFKRTKKNRRKRKILEGIKDEFMLISNKHVCQEINKEVAKPESIKTSSQCGTKATKSKIKQITHQRQERKHIPSDNGYSQCHSESDEEEISLAKLVESEQTNQRDLNRKRKEAIGIDYTMDGSCATCNEKFELFSKYCEHMLKAHVNNQWICLTCNRKLQCRYDFERHLRKHLPKNSIIKHICPICGLKLSCSTTFNRHLAVHSDKMQHLCEHCGRAFKRDATLKAHMILHTGQKPYGCNFCQLTFACSSNCRRHMRKAHTEEFAAFRSSCNNIQT